MANIRTVLFDLDGTILDTNELIFQSYLHALQGIVPPSFGREQIIPGMGMPLVDLMRQYSGLDEVDHLIAAYREYNLAKHDELVTAFPHVPEVLSALRAAGLKLGVVTTKMRLTTERGLRYVGIYDEMSSIVTIDDVRHPKPHPEPVLTALRELDADPAGALMVGDSAADMQAAAAAGVKPVGVAWSLKGEAKLLEAGAQAIIRDMRELYELVGMEREPRGQER